MEVPRSFKKSINLYQVAWRRSRKSESQQTFQRNTSSAHCLLHSGFLLDFHFDPEDEGDVCLRNLYFCQTTRCCTLSIYDSRPFSALVLFQFLVIFTQLVGFFGRGSARRRYLHTGQHRNTEYRHTDIHDLSGILNQDPSVGASEDISYLRPCGHCDQWCCTLENII
jgi:hypothetical protein